LAEERAKYNALLAEIENAVAPLEALYEKGFNGATPGFPEEDALEKEVTWLKKCIEADSVLDWDPGRMRGIPFRS